MSLVWQSPKISGIFRIFDDKCLKIRGIATASVRTGFAMTAFFKLCDISEFDGRRYNAAGGASPTVFGGLTDDNGAGANDRDFLNVRSSRHTGFPHEIYK